MNDKIEVGEYVRTNDGTLGKLLRVENDDIDTSLKWYVLYAPNSSPFTRGEIYTNKPYIIKHSKKIINLIGKGDYYNGIPIIHKLKNGRIQLLTGHLLSNEDIKEGDNIVTKEQFSSIEYKV